MKAVNLIPADARRTGRSMPTGLPFLGLVCGLVVVLVATVLFVIAHNRVESRQSQLTSVQANAARWSAAAATFAHDVSVAQLRQTKIGAVEGLVGQRTNWSELLGQLAAVMPARSRLSSMNATAAAPTAAAPTPAAAATTATTGSTTTPAPAQASASSASSIQLSACAASQSVVAQTMVALRRISGVSKVYLASSTSNGSSGSGSCGFPVTFSVTLAFVPPTSSTSATMARQPTSDSSSTTSASGVSQ